MCVFVYVAMSISVCVLVCVHVPLSAVLQPG